MMRRGFTLLEVSMAAVIAGACALAALSLYTGLLSADRVLGRRFAEATELERTRLIIERCFMSLVTSDKRPPRSRQNQNQNKTNSNQQTTDNDTVDPQAQKPEPPRVILEHDTDPILKSLGGNVQRLELVLLRSPVPTLAKPGTYQPERNRDIHPSDSQSISAIRGVLELRPQVYKPGDRAEQDRHRVLMELWWKPLPPRADDGSLIVANWVPPGPDYMLCHNIETAVWKVFKAGVYVTDYSATYTQDLPAYAKLEMKTSDGFQADWMFEINFAAGAEVSDNDSNSTDNGTSNVIKSYNNIRSGGTR